ncbi:MAG: FAD:protein FMN transferase [Puniceicoccales bacterium]|jgi:thiamine biosynthesis lipoprotein|nr:FAD:protein FMN transferase [Puniceicoccales bacterium]
MSDNIAKKSLRFDHKAMNAMFTIFVDSSDTDPAEAEEAANSAFATLDKLAHLLTRYSTTSDVAHANTLQGGDSHALSPETFECLTLAAELAAETGRAFDPAAGTLTDFWKSNPIASLPGEPIETPEWRIAWEAHRVGEFSIDPQTHELFCISPGSKLDLGAIGKGFALDEMARILEGTHSISRALLSAGGSTVLALDAPLLKPGWKIGFGGETTLPYLLLSRAAISSSGVHNQPTHLVDPRTGHVVTRTKLVRAYAPRAAEADALSTAFFVMERTEMEDYCASHMEHVALLTTENDKGVPTSFDIIGNTSALLWQEREDSGQTTGIT